MEPIAIVGMSGRFPGAATVCRYWANLRAGVESITRLSRDDLLCAGVDAELAARPTYVSARGVLDGIELFDASFFGMSARSAALLDPQQRIFLECAWEALESAGYDVDRFPGDIGVVAGCSSNQYHRASRPTPSADGDAFEEVERQLGDEKDSLALRTAYKLNLKGPALTVQTTCSTSLVSVVLACRALAARDCDAVIAGGVSIAIPHKTGYLYVQGGISSPDGHCRAFDANASGTVSGSGCGVVVLKRLADAMASRDTIQAIILGAAINNDGADKVGFTAPSIAGQANVIRRALASADISADTISYVECHGTGTRLGDPIELAGLALAFSDAQSAGKRCAIGSVKTNIGHLDAAAGIAGLIKTVLALRHGELPASLHFREANPDSCLQASRFFVNVELGHWTRQGGPRRAGVSSFGIGGTNAHVVLQEAPEASPGEEARPCELLLLSAKTPDSLARVRANLAAHLADQSPIDLSDVAYTLQVGRKQFAQRWAALVHSPEEAVDVLREKKPLFYLGDVIGAAPEVCFVFPGQGAGRRGMARDVYEHEPAFREAFDQCAMLLMNETGLDLVGKLYGPPGCNGPERVAMLMDEAQPALFAVEYALAALWRDWELTPSAMLGDGVGEFVAAHLAGVISLVDALRVVSARGRLLSACPPAATLTVGVPECEVSSLIGDGGELAVVDGHTQCTVSGSLGAISDVERRLTTQGVIHRRLSMSHALHSAAIDGAITELRNIVSKVALHPPVTPVVSGVTGTWLSASTATDPDYWASQLRRAVRLSDGLDTMTTSKRTIVLEVGPAHTLTNVARRRLASASDCLLVNSLAGDSTQRDLDALWTAAGRIWLTGYNINWGRAHRHERRKRVELPTYPFERRRHWLKAEDRPRNTVDNVVNTTVLGEAPAPETVGDTFGTKDVPIASDTSGSIGSGTLEQTIADIWRSVLGVSEVGLDADFFELGGESLLLLQMAARVRRAIGIDLAGGVFFDEPTIRSLCTRIRAITGARSSSGVERAPLQYGQQGEELLARSSTHKRMMGGGR